MNDEFDPEVERRFADGIKQLGGADPVVVERLAATVAGLPAKPNGRAGRGWSRTPAVVQVAAALVVVAVAVGALVMAVGGTVHPTPSVEPSSSGPSPTPGTSTVAEGVVPWLDATPSPVPTPEPTPDSGSYPACLAADLVLQAEGWGGATGSMAGGANVVNLGAPCTVSGRPVAELLDAQGHVVAPGGTASGAEPGVGPVVLPAGGVAGVILVWSNWCGTPPTSPLTVRLTLPDQAGTLTATVRQAAAGGLVEVPRCDNPGAGSGLGIPTSFAAPEPSSGSYQPTACAVDGLAGYLGEWGAAAGTWYARVVVANRGPVDCLLDSAPSFELRDSAGALLTVAQSDPSPTPATGILLPAGWAAVATIGFSDWCTAQPAIPLAADLRIGADRLVIQARSPIPVPACMSAPATPATPAALYYNTPFAIPGSPIAPEPDPLDSLPVSVTIPALPPVSPGATLDYTVTLTNTDTYAKPISLAALCPAYTQRLFLPGSGGTIEQHFALNCTPVGTLQPGVPVTFAMRLQIPADATPGVATLVWQLGTAGPAAKVTFQVQPQ